MNPEDELPQTIPEDSAPVHEESVPSHPTREFTSERKVSAVQRETSTSQEKVPVAQSEVRRPSSKPKTMFAAILLLVCIVGGGVLILQFWHSSSPTVNPSAVSNGNPVTLSKPWCAPPASLSANFAGTSISGLAENDVWSAGAQIMHWDGHAWSVAFTPSSPQDIFRSIVEIAPNDIWVVGEHLTNGLSSHALLLHWNGTRWQTLSSPDAAVGGKNALVAVSGTSPHDVWAVGFSVPSQGPLAPLMERWNGSQWSIVTHLDVLGSAQLTSVKALSPTDAWAVGYQYTTSPHAGKNITQPVTERWDGKLWRSVTNPSLVSFGGGSLYNVGGSSASDLWAVGSVNNGMLTEHWDGHSWSMIASPSVPPDSSNWLASVAAAAPDNVWAVGRDKGNATGFQPFIEHWDGHQWQVMQDPTDNAGELDIVTTIGQQFWVVGIPKTDGGHSFIETLCP